MRRYTSFLIAVSAASGLLYAAVMLATADDLPQHNEVEFLDNIQVGQTVVLVEREPGLYSILLGSDATLAELEQVTKRFSNRTLDHRQVTGVTESFVELRGQDPADVTRPDGFDNVTIIPLHAIHSIAYYSPEKPGDENPEEPGNTK